jgi:hypothetical protein
MAGRMRIRLVLVITLTVLFTSFRIETIISRGLIEAATAVQKR